MLSSYTHVVGIILEGGCHWTFVAINMKRKNITYLDPMGNESNKCQRLLRNWESFTTEWNAEMEKIKVDKRIANTGYTSRTVLHPVQQAGDTITCGIYSCMVNIIYNMSCCKMNYFQLSFDKRKCFYFSVCVQLLSKGYNSCRPQPMYREGTKSLFQANGS
jgi:Ulp1 family protease